MKEENFDGIRPNRDAWQTGDNARQPFNPANESRSDGQRETPRRIGGLSKPPRRDMSGRRVDVDDTNFGVELW